MRKEKGITLLALVVTIVILIILATVSINIVVEDGGVFTKAEQAKYVYEMSEVQQRFDMALLEVKAKNKGQAPVDKYIEHLKEKGIIDPNSMVENPDGSIEVTTPDGWVAQIEKEEDGEYVKRVVVEGEADNLPVRIINVQLTPTTHDITVKLTVLRGEKAKYSYYYKQGAITDEEKSLSGEDLVKNHSWKKAADKTESLEIVIGDDIEQAQQYAVMVEALEENVVKSRGYATARTTDVPIATGAITFGELSWENGLAKVEVSKTTEDYYLQYQVVAKGTLPVNDKWKTVGEKTTNEVEVGKLDLGQVVVARLWDGYKGGASISSIEVKDEEKPQLEITKTESTTNSITVTILATDAESGMGESPTYKYYIKEKDGEYGAAQEDTSLSHTYTDLNQGTEYIVKVEVEDRAGNAQTKEKLDAIKTETIPDAGDGISTGAITFEDLGWANKKVSVNITKTDTNYYLQWQKIAKGSSLNNNGWTTESNKATNTKSVTDLSLGDQVVARLWDGRQGGNTATFTVKDETKPTVNITKADTTTNSITITISVADAEAGMEEKPTYKYYIKEKNGQYGAAQEDTKLIHTYTGLNQETEYIVKVEVSDIAGNVQIKEKPETIKTGKIPDAGDGIKTGAITFKDLGWSNKKVSVDITKTDTNYYLQWQKVAKGSSLNNNGWTTESNKATNTKSVTDLSLGDQVVARLWDGRQGGNTATFTVKDETKPTVDITKAEPTTNSITITISVADAEAGMEEKPTYKYYIKEKNGQYGVAQEDTSLTHTYTGLNQETEYIVKVEVKDIAGNVQIKEKPETIKTGTIPAGGDGVSTGAITFKDAKWANKKQSVNITKTDTNYYLQWQKVAKGSSLNDNSWTTESSKTTNTKSVTNLSLGDKVVARLWDGRQFGSSATFTVKDGVNPSATINLNGKTTINEGEAINATVTHSDGQSGIDISKCKWILNTQSAKLGTADNSYTGTFTAESQSLTPTISTAGTYYLHVLSVDMTGTNKVETVSGAIKVENPKPFKGQYSDIQKSTTTIKDNKGNSMVIPGGFKLADNSAETVQDGMVIEDGSGNQFVWIPVSNINADGTGKIVKKDGSTVEITLGRYRFDLSEQTTTLVQKGSDYSKIVNLEPLTQNTSRDQLNYYQELPTFREANTEGKVDTVNATAKNLKGFVESVQKYHGYYIGRYEASFGSGSGYGVGNGYYKPLSKKSTSVRNDENVTLKTGMLWNYITQGNASKVSRNMYNGNTYVESDLINSYMWDTAMIYLKQMGHESYLYQGIKADAISNTGAGSDVICNIYDLASNMEEMSTEYINFTDYEHTYDQFGNYTSTTKVRSRPWTRRGGVYGYWTFCAASRNYTVSGNSFIGWANQETPNDETGFRVGLFVK